MRQNVIVISSQIVVGYNEPDYSDLPLIPIVNRMGVRGGLPFNDRIVGGGRPPYIKQAKASNLRPLNYKSIDSN